MKTTTIIILFFLIIGKSGIAQSNQKSSQLTLDPRIETHYSAAEIKALKQTNPLEIKKLNYYFQDSFIIIPSTSPGAEPIDLWTIDVKRFENQRHATERKTIIISKYDDKLILKSKEEVEKEYDKILNSKN